MQKYAAPRPAPLPADFDEFYEQLTPAEKQLHELAIEKLGSSYFVQWTHMYTKWIKLKADKAKTEELKADKAKTEELKSTEVTP